jgi:isoleucyl-tRNA synthetase
MAPAFEPLPSVPDHPALEREVLEWWERERIFDRLREQNRGGPKWSFIDGPVTANKPLALHTAWGRTLKDVFQRWMAMRGFEQRYQNGFDCQGLWVEVGVERELGLNSKREIEEYGLAEFARRCREKVIACASELTKGSKRLGQWMDWGNDYFTFSDTNIEYIWRFLKLVHERGWLFLGHRSTEWCPRCGTSISQHELSQAGVYQDKTDPSLFVRLPLVGRPESLVVWTTTPWTLPANVAAAVKPDAEYGLHLGEWTLAEAGRTYDRIAKGEELVGLRYEGPFDDLPAVQGVEHRVIPWDDVALDEGTGIVHIAPGAGQEDFELGRVHDLPVLTPVDESGRFYDDYGWLHGLSTSEAADQITAVLAERGRLVSAETIVHRYPHCWRCDTALIFRITDDWFIAVDEIRPKLLEANAAVAWTPEYMGKRMDDWLRNLGDWNISRRRYFGLPLPFYPCSCGHLNVIGSRPELEERATSGLEQLEELHRPWIDEVVILCEACGEEVRRVPEVGDVWLDAGIVPFSTLGWRNERWIENGYATGASRGLSGADLPDHAYWETWFPADWVSEMREQIRLWFYSLLFMSVVLEGRAPYRSVLGYEKMLDEQGREMHGSWGNAIRAEEAFERMGADVMRWQFCAQPPDRNLLFGYGPAHEIKGKLLRLWHSVKFLVDYANIEGFRPTWGELPQLAELRPLDRWLLERTHVFVREATEQGYEQLQSVNVIRAFESYLDDLSNWYIRRSRRRFWDGDRVALHVLWLSLVQSLRVVAPVMPFLTEHLWRRLVADVDSEAPASIFLAGRPDAPEPDTALVAEIAAVRRVVELGRQARAARSLKLRQPLRTAVVFGADLARAHAAEIADELRVKEVQFESGGAGRQRLKPNLRLLGPRLGAKLPAVRRALEEGRYERQGDGVLVEGERLSEDELIVEPQAVNDGWAAASDADVSVELDPSLDDELRREGRVLDLIHRLNEMRKAAGLELTDRIVVRLPSADADLVEQHAEWIKSEVLAVTIELDGAAGEPQIAKA